MSFDNFTYYRMMEESLKEIKKENKKPTLLLHSCCAPCNAYPLVLLIEYFDLTLMYNNSNIYPFEEYTRRLNELKDYVNYINKTHNVNIKLIINDLFFLLKLKPHSHLFTALAFLFPHLGQLLLTKSKS